MNIIDKIAITSRSFSSNEKLVSELKQRYKEISFNNTGKTLEGDELINFLKGKSKAIVGLESINESLIDKLPNLKVISKFGVGLNNIDLKAMKKKSIALGFKAGTNKQSVAELALFLILMSLRRIPSSKEEIIARRWNQNKGNELYAKTIGIIGFGNIGQKLAHLLEPFQCRLIFFDSYSFSKKDILRISRNQKNKSLENIQQKTLKEILIESDVISIHLPLLHETRNIIGEYEMSIMKSDVRVVNTSRGGVVDEKALLNFLNNNQEAFASFDVFETEPAFDNPLLNLANFYATSHLGSMTLEGVISMGMAAIDGLDENDIPI